MSDEAVARALLACGRATRAELSVVTGLSKPTVADAIRRLEAKGLVRDTGERTTGRGGVGTYYAPGPLTGVALVVVIAPEGIVAEVIDATGTIHHRVERVVNRPASPRSVRRLLTTAARAAVRTVGGEPVCVAVVSAADPVDRTTGALVHLPDSPFLVGELDPAVVLASMVDGPVVVDNDVNWAARLERALRSHDAPLDDFCYLFLGEGLGAAIISDGEVRRGHHGFAGEVSHIVTAGPEGVATAFIDVFGRLGLRHADSTAIDIPALLAAIEQPHVLDTIATAISDVITALVALTDPSSIVLGGSWGVDERVTNAVRMKVSTTARPVDIEHAHDHDAPAEHGARDAATRLLHDLVGERARSSQVGESRA